jgi:uncharacterized protein (DUF885 family)
VSAIDGLIDEFLNSEWEESPTRASSLGIDGFDDKLGDYSEQAHERRDAKTDEWLRRFGAVPDDGLTPDERLDRDLILSTLRGRVVMREWKSWKRQPAGYVGAGLSGVFSLFLHRIRSEAELASSAASRLLQVPDVLDDGKTNLDPALVAPLFAERALGQCRAGAHYARNLVPLEVADPALREMVAGAGEVAAKAYEDFADFLVKLQADAKGDWAIGEELYTAQLLEREMLGYGATEMLERGLALYEELSADMSRRAREIAGHDDWRTLVGELNQDHPDSLEAMLRAYTEWTDRAKQFVYDRSLVTLPQGERCLVEPSPPFQRPVAAVASYASPPAFKPSLTGHFFVPYTPDGASDEEVRKRLETNATFTIPDVAVHEAYPGHHAHLVTAQQNPRPARKVFGTSYITEGWGLYTEVMMREQGFFTDPRQELCQVDMRLFRAARIIVDTSLHMGRMGFEEAVTFMHTKASLSEPTARAEVGRYCSAPTQASSYLIGAVEIDRMRERFTKEGRGSLRDFHDKLVGSGMLPIALAERAVMA